MSFHKSYVATYLFLRLFDDIFVIIAFDIQGWELRGWYKLYRNIPSVCKYLGHNSHIFHFSCWSLPVQKKRFVATLTDVAEERAKCAQNHIDINWKKIRKIINYGNFLIYQIISKETEDKIFLFKG